MNVLRDHSLRTGDLRRIMSHDISRMIYSSRAGLGKSISRRFARAVSFTFEVLSTPRFSLEPFTFITYEEIGNVFQCF